MDSLGSILKRLREKKRYTQAEVIEKSGLDRSPSYISSLETSRTSPTVDELDRLAVLYGATLHDIVSEWKGIKPNWDFTPNPDVQLLLAFYGALEGARRATALEYIQFLAERQLMEKRKLEHGDVPSSPS